MPANTVRADASDVVFFTAIENGHSVRAACSAACYSRTRVYTWRLEDPAFAARWVAARAAAGDLLEEEADRRGRDGYDEPVYFRGKEVGVKRKYSDGLLLARLKAIRPEDYRERTATPPVSQQSVTVLVRDFALEALMKKLVEQKKVALQELPPRLRSLVESAHDRPSAAPHSPALPST